MTEDEMVGWHHRLNGHELEQAPGSSISLSAAAPHMVMVLLNSEVILSI